LSSVEQQSTTANEEGEGEVAASEGADGSKFEQIYKEQFFKERENSEDLLKQLRQAETESRLSAENELQLSDQVTKLMLEKREVEERARNAEDDLYQKKAGIEQL
jgi:hypothetical protein